MNFPEDKLSRLHEGKDSLSKSALDILAKLKAVSTTYAPSCAAIYRWVTHFYGEKSIVTDNRVKAKNRTATDDKMVARVKNSVKEDLRVTSQDITEILGISSGSISNVQRYKLGYGKI